MAKRKTPDKFRVGQRVVLVLDDATRWERAHGEPGVVVGPKTYGAYHCSPMYGSGPTAVQRGYRYAVRCSFGVRHFCEGHLRSYDGDEISTWEKFTEVTGIDLAAIRVVAKPVKQRPRGRQPSARIIMVRRQPVLVTADGHGAKPPHVLARNDDAFQKFMQTSLSTE